MLLGTSIIRRNAFPTSNFQRAGHYGKWSVVRCLSVAGPVAVFRLAIFEHRYLGDPSSTLDYKLSTVNSFSVRCNGYIGPELAHNGVQCRAVRATVCSPHHHGRLMFTGLNRCEG